MKTHSPLTVIALCKAATSEDGLKEGQGLTADPGPPLYDFTACYVCKRYELVFIHSSMLVFVFNMATAS